MASKTNTGLVSYAKKQVGLPYWYGTFGNTASESLYNSKKKQYPEQYTASDFSTQYGKRVHDCVGLIKGYIWSDSATASPDYNSTQDKSANGMYTASATAKRGKISTIEDVAGVLVYKGSSTKSITHVGVYGGDGYVYEAKGHAYGVVKTKYKASDWNYWSECPYITYSTTSSTTSTSTSSASTTSSSTSSSSTSKTTSSTSTSSSSSKSTTSTSTSSSSSSTTSTSTTMYVKTNGSNLNVRKSGSTSAKIVGKLANGTKVTVTSTSNGWSKIKSPEGYVSAQYLTSKKPSSTTYKVSTKSKNLNCRAKASSTGKIVGSFAKGTKVTGSGVTSGSWIYVSGKGTSGKTIEGYCKNTYLTKC